LLKVIELQPQLIDAFSQLIANTLGFQLREQTRNAFWQKVVGRVKALGLPSIAAYHHLLQANGSNALDDPEWREIINFLSVTESYFFRDQGQFSLIKNHVLPELIARKRRLARQGAPGPRSLRLWSAGCATGEEAYSLAILLKELIPSDEEWTITVLGTDINWAALFQAQRGVYNTWSFRSVQSEILNKYFHPYQQNWMINPDLRSLVYFQVDNLLQNSPISSSSYSECVDLIICRNVFIYFTPDAITQVLNRFNQSLSPGGYLITGHTELHGRNYLPFQVKTFPESTVYQRAEETIPAIHPIFPINYHCPETSISAPKLSQPCLNSLEPVQVIDHASETAVVEPDLEAINNATSNLELLMALLERKAYTDAIAQAQLCITQNQAVFQAYCVLAEVYANLGQYEQATQACEQALQLDPLGVEPLYLLAHVAQEQHDLERAKTLLKRVIYLLPTAILAYFELGCLYAQQGNLKKAQRNWRLTWKELSRLSEDSIINGSRGLTVAELKMAVEQRLNPEVLPSTSSAKAL